MYAQNWERLHYYPNDYLNLVYNFYARHKTDAFLCTYYRLDLQNSVCDKTLLDAAAYEETGDLSGLVWEKILLFPVYNVEYIDTSFIADERGFGQFEQVSSFNFPNTYDFYPTTWDYVNFQAIVLNKNQEENKPDPSLYRVVHIGSSTNTFITFWKVNLKSHHTRIFEIENQVRETFAFFDYEKRIYPAESEVTLYNMIKKNSELQLNNYYKENLGFYFGA